MDADMDLLQETAAKFVGTEVIPHLDRFDRQQRADRDLWTRAGTLIGTIAMTEPGAGSDLKGVTTRAVRHRDRYLVSGAKTFISNGATADLVIVVAKTDPAAGARGISLLVVETGDAPGFTRGRVLQKVGQHGQDTAELFFDEVPVPVANRLGSEGGGFAMLMEQLRQERLTIGVVAVAAMERALSEAVAYAKERHAFGGTLFDLQHVRFELAECATLARAARVFVDDAGREVPRGTVGEIVVRGGHVMLGYWRQPDATAEALRDGWMHTGDGAYMDDDGYVFIVDRLKDMIVSGGENVYSAEVENALAKHPAVASCAVIGVPDRQWGERVHAVVVLAPDRKATADELRAHCKEHIAGYKSPRSVEFVDALPLSGAGKILKRELREKYWEHERRSVH